MTFLVSRRILLQVKGRRMRAWSLFAQRKIQNHAFGRTVACAVASYLIHLSTKDKQNSKKYHTQLFSVLFGASRRQKRTKVSIIWQIASDEHFLYSIHMDVLLVWKAKEAKKMHQLECFFFWPNEKRQK